MTKQAQLTLWAPLKHPQTCRTCGATRPEDNDNPTWCEPVSGECFTCNQASLWRFMRWYATHGRPGRGKHPGMSFPSGNPVPTPEDRAWAHALLDETGVPR